jgi:two-component system, LytTR family, response regulator LytT
MRILLIEDEPPAARRLQKLLEKVLENLGEWGKVPAEVTWIGDADLALAEAAKGPELIFLDLNLGGFHSLEWLREARLPADRILIVSAETRYCDEALGLGVFAYLFKPVDEAQLRFHLERFLRGRNLIA